MTPHFLVSAFVIKQIAFVTIQGSSEFSSYEIKLRNRVTQNDVTLRVTNSKSKNKKLHFELLTRGFNFYCFAFELLIDVWNFILSRSSYKNMKNIKLNLKLLT